jgi:hypothetical protein
MYATKLNVNNNADKDIKNGQGLESTIWKGCCSLRASTA